LRDTVTRFAPVPGGILDPYPTSNMLIHLQGPIWNEMKQWGKYCIYHGKIL
jgi:hypothetical protein